LTTEIPETASRSGVLSLGVLILAACLPLVFAVPLADWPQHVQQMKLWFAGIGDIAPLIFTLGAALLTALGMPRLMFCALGGLLFGFTWGFVWSHLGTVLGAYGAFVFARCTARGYLLRRYPRLQQLSARIEGTGWWSVVLIRQMPISGLYNDFLLALSPVRHGAFWIGTTLGFLPLGVTATLVGAGTMQADLSALAQYFTAAAASFLLLSLAWKWLVAKARNTRTA